MPAPRACHRYMVLLASLLAALTYANPNKCTCGLSAPTGIDLLTASPIMGGIVSTNDNLITTPAIVTGTSRGAYTANEAKTFTLNAATFGGGIIHASAGVLSGWTGAAAVSLMVSSYSYSLYMISTDHRSYDDFFHSRPSRARRLKALCCNANQGAAHRRSRGRRQRRYVYGGGGVHPICVHHEWILLFDFEY